MDKAKILQDFAQKFSESLPPSLTHLRQEFEQHLCRGLGSALEKLNLVTREEFDVQTEVLARSRKKLEALEAKIAALKTQQTLSGDFKSQEEKNG